MRGKDLTERPEFESVAGEDRDPLHSSAASTTKPDTEVESMTMAKKVLPFPAPDAGAARPTAVEHCRATFQIGARRFVFEFRTAVSEVNPVDAEIVSIRTGQIDPRPNGARKR